MNDKTQLDLFGTEEIPVSDEIKEAIIFSGIKTNKR